MLMVKRAVGFWFIITSLLFPIGVHAVDLHYEINKTYGTLQQIAVIEVPGDGSLAQEIYTLFATSKPYFKVVNPSSLFLDSPSFLIYESAAGGWYLTLPTENSTLGIISNFLSKTSHPVVVELNSYNTSFIQNIKSQFPSIKIHAGHYPFWPREDVKAAFAQTPPPTMEAVSIWFEETSSDMFDTVKLLFDTMFDASNDIPGTSGVKINYPANSFLALSDIKPKFSEELKKTAFRLGVAGGAAVSFVQTQEKSKKAPIKYVGLGQYSTMSSTSRTIVARYARFLSLTPQVIWPMSMAGNGNPYDNDFFAESNSKPIMGIIGVISGKPEGVIVNASNKTTSVKLPGDIGIIKAYSSLTGDFTFSSSFQMSPYETIIFGATISNSDTASPPLITPPIKQPTKPQPTIPTKPTTIFTPAIIPTTISTMPQPTSIFPPSSQRPTNPSPHPIYFPLGSPQEDSQQTRSSPAGKPMRQITFQLKNNLRFLVIKTDLLLQTIKHLFIMIKTYDNHLEQYINSLFINRLF